VSSWHNENFAEREVSARALQKSSVADDGLDEAGLCILSYLMLACITGLVCTAKMSKRAPFIVVEGLDRSGKTTQTEKLLTRLTESGVQAKLVKFPGMPKVLLQ